MPSIDDVTVRRATAWDNEAIARNGDVYNGKDYLHRRLPADGERPGHLPSRGRVERSSLRRATARDHEAIIRNGDVYDGTDYLTTVFPRVVNDPEVYPVVAEVKGQVVGFMMDHVLDGGMSIIRRSGRTIPSYRKLGVMLKMYKALTKLSAHHFPNARYRSICISEHGHKRASKFLQSSNFVEILRKPILVYRVPEITGLDVKDELPAVLALEYDDVKTVFTLDDLLEHLFPQKILFNFFIGYRCLESNIKHVLDENKEVCVTTKTPPWRPDTTISVLKDIDMVTFSERYMAEAGLVYAIDIYAKEGHSEASLQAHLRRHLTVFKEANLSERGVLYVSLGSNLCKETVRSCLRRFGIVDRLPNADNWMALFEKKC